MWLGATELPKSPGHKFYESLNELLRSSGFDCEVERLCGPYFDANLGRPSVAPGVYFRMLLVGYFEGIESERGLEWRCSDSLSLRSFIGVLVNERVPDHSTLSRMRTRLPETVYEAVFKHVLAMVETAGLLRGRVVGVDSTYLRADASMKTIVRRDTGEDYGTYVKALCEKSGIEAPTAEDAQRMDRSRKGKRTSNEDWQSSTDAEAEIARLKDGRTRLAYKAEHVVDLETGVVVAAEILPATAPDTRTLEPSLSAARSNIEDARASDDDDDDHDEPGPNAGNAEDAEPQHVIEVVGDKGYHTVEGLLRLKDAGYRTYIPAPKNPGKKRHFRNKGGMLAREAFYSNRARCSRAKGKRYLRKRGEFLERTFAHACETGAHRRTRLRGRSNVRKRYLVHIAGLNLGIVMRARFGHGTPREMAGRAARALVFGLIALLRALYIAGRTSVVALGTILQAGLATFRLGIPRLDSRRSAFSTGC
jgi:transposase